MTPPPSTGTRAHKDFLSILDLEPAELDHCLRLAAQVKTDRSLGPNAPTANALTGRHVAMLFEKSSLRTRSTFEVAVRELGGNVLVLEPDAGIGAREPVADVARNLERWVDAVVIRTFSQQLIRDFASAAPRLHVVNALTDEEHPCQTLADLLTLREHLGLLKGRTIAYVGDGNNVALSLVQGAAMVGMHAHVASPDGYQLPNAAIQRVTEVARDGARLRLFTHAADAVEGVDAVYTDTWTSMGREAEAPARRKAFKPYQVDEILMRAAKPGALFMHCLPAHRGEEVTAGVIESSFSVVFDQAENRLHVQKALLLMLLAPTIV
jgi:ornithine carbamoyltransferase